MDAKARIRQFLCDNFVLDRDRSVSDDESLLENGIVDSTGVMELVVFVEETFSIRVLDEEVVPDNFDSVGRLADYVARKAAAPVPWGR
jgi:acyl carrier protein